MKFTIGTTITLSVRGIEVEAPSEEDAKDLVAGMDLDELFESGTVDDEVFDFETMDVMKTAENLKVRCRNITYDLYADGPVFNGEDDYLSDEDEEEMLDSLPKTLVIVLKDVDPDISEEDLRKDLEYEIKKITYTQPTDFDFEILKRF